MFVIRADGSVVSKAQQGGVFVSNRFESMRLMPGDAIVVPQRIRTRSSLAALRDWTQIFSQLALGAAAIAVLASGTSSLPKAAAWAAGALVACYCLGPGSRSCRRPLSRLYGRLTTSAFGAAAGFASLAALAGAAVIAAAALTPGYWPADHLGQQLQAATLHHSLLRQWPGSLTRLGREIMTWVGHRF